MAERTVPVHSPWLLFVVLKWRSLCSQERNTCNMVWHRINYVLFTGLRCVNRRERSCSKHGLLSLLLQSSSLLFFFLITIRCSPLASFTWRFQNFISRIKRRNRRFGVRDNSMKHRATEGRTELGSQF